MDSRDTPQPPDPQLQPPPGMLMYHYRNPNAAAMMGPTSTSQSSRLHLPFGSLAPRQTLQQQQQQIDQKTLGFGDVSPSSQPMPVEIDQSQNQYQNQQQQVRNKRGRPRNYVPEGNIPLGLTPTSHLLSAASSSYGGDGGVGDSGGGGENVNSADPPAKRKKGRPPGSGKKQLDALGTTGLGFTPHVIEVNAGEDIALKVMAISKQGPRTVCILSANGAVSTMTLHQASNPSGRNTYEGHFEIITLSGSFLNYEVNGSTEKRGSLTVALAGREGHILCGRVVGPLVAATQVQVIVGSFVAEAKKRKQRTVNNAQGQNPEPASAPPANMMNVGSNPQGTSIESSDENEYGSSMQRDNNNNGIDGNSVAQQQRLHQMQM